MKYLLITMILFLISIPAKGQSEYVIQIDSTGKVSVDEIVPKIKGKSKAEIDSKGKITLGDIKIKGKDSFEKEDLNGVAHYKIKLKDIDDNRIKIAVAKGLLLSEQNDLINGINKKWQRFLDSIGGICGECHREQPDLLDSIFSVHEKITVNGKPLKEKENIETLGEQFELDVKIENNVYTQLCSLRSELISSIRSVNDFEEDMNFVRNFSILRELMSGKTSNYDCCEDYRDWYYALKNKSGCSNRLGQLEEIDFDLLKLYFINSLLVGKNNSQNKLDDYQSELRYIEVQLKELGDLINQDRIIKTVEEGKKNYTNVEVLKALLDRKNNLVKRKMELNDLVNKLPADQLDKNLVWYEQIWVFNGTISLKAANGKTVMRSYDFARSIKPLHKPNFPGTVYKENQNMVISILNIPGGQEFKFDTSQLNVKVENTLFADDIDNIPGLSNMLGLIGEWSVPSIVPKYIGGARMSPSGSALIAGQNERQLIQGILFYKEDVERVEEFVRATDSLADVGKDQKLKSRTTQILDTFERYGQEVFLKEIEKIDPRLKNDDCCCQKICMQMDSLCINGEFVKIPVKMLPEDGKRFGLCFNPCQMFSMELKYFWYEGLCSGSLERESWSKKKCTDTPLYKAMTKTYDLGPGSKHISFYLKTKSGNESHLLEQIYVSKLYRFTAGVGAIYQNGFPYQVSLNTSTNTLERTYFNRIALTGGIKWYPFKTSIREPLRTGLKYRLNSTRKNYARPRLCNLHTKLSIYAGFTISKKPYEFIFLGVGFDLTPGLTIFGAHRWNWEDKVVVSGGNTFITQGYSRYNAPGSFGFGVLIDPVIATRFFKK